MKTIFRIAMLSKIVSIIAYYFNKVLGWVRVELSFFGAKLFVSQLLV